MAFRTALLASTLIGLGLVAHAQTSADDIHRSALIFDPHVDIPSPYDWTRDGKVIAPEIRSDQVSTERLLAGAYDAVGLSVFVPQTARNEDTYALARAEADAKLDYIDALVSGAPDTYVLALTADDVQKAEAAGKVAIVPTLLNAFPLGKTADSLDHFQARGIRILGLTHAGHNDFADSDRPQARDPETEHGGLSEEGRKLIRKANDLGILIDVSQISHEAFIEVINLSRAPVIASHSGIYALAPSPRSLTDEELDLIKSNGGVAGIVAFSSYLVATPEEVSKQIDAIHKKHGVTNGYEGLSIAQRDALSAERDAIRPKATVQDYVNAIDYAVNRIGIDHVAISTDFNHGGGVTGWSDASEALAVTSELLARGYSADDISRLWGGNALRVLRTAQENASVSGDVASTTPPR